MRKTLFVKNAAVLTVSSLILRFLGIIFKVWLAKKIGAEGMGLYQLVFSLYIVAAAGIQSGLPVAVTRMVAEAGESSARFKSIMSKAFVLNFFVSVLTGGALFFGARFLSRTVISDPRAALSLKVLAFSVLFMGLSSVMRGFFIARRRAAPSAISQVLEQLFRIATVLLAVKFTAGKPLYITCAAVFLGDTVAEILACLYLYIMYLREKHKTHAPQKKGRGDLPRLFGISLPITAGKLLGNLLRAAENMVVPRALAVFSQKGALAMFGMIKGMALPVLFFPSALLGAVSTLLVPEMSEAAKTGKIVSVRYTVEDVLKAAAIGGFIFSAIFTAAGHKIGSVLYGSADVGFLITALGPIVSLMYLDSLCDGLLKGLNQQNFTFRVAVIDSAGRLLAVFPVVSHFGVKGFIGIMYVSNLFTALLNTNRLIKISGAAPDAAKSTLTPLLTAFCTTLLVKLILDFFVLPDLVYIILISGASATIYALLLYRFGCMNFWSVGRIRPHKKYESKTIITSLIK